MLVFFTGRKTGRRYRQPVSYVEDGGVLLTPGGGRWKLNLTDGEAIRIRLRGRDVQARPDLVRDLDEVDLLLRRMMAVNPRLASFVPFVGPGAEIDRSKLRRAVEHGFAIVRWTIAKSSLPDVVSRER